MRDFSSLSRGGSPGAGPGGVPGGEGAAYDGGVSKELTSGSWASAVVVGLSVLSSAATAWLAVLLGRALDIVLAGGRLETPWFVQVFGALLLAAAGLLLVPVVVQRASFAMGNAVRARLLEHYLAIGPLALSRGGHGERVNIAMDAVDRMVRYRAGFIGPALAAVLTPFIVLGFVALYVDALAAAILAGLALLVPVIVLGFSRIFRASSGAYRRAQGTLAAVFMDALRNLGMLKLNNAAGWMGAKVAAAAENVRVQVMKLLARNQLVLLVIDATFATLLLASSAILAWWKLSSGDLGPGGAVSLVALSFLMLAPVNYVGSFFYIGMTGRAAETRIRQSLGEARHPGMLEPLAVDLRSTGIRLEGVAAGYDEGQTAIDALNLNFPPGSRTAIIGASGSGKTTLLRLLAGQLETSAGIIHDGRQAMGTATLRLNTAVVDQNINLFAMSLRENLTLADEQASDAELIELLHRVGLGTWFSRLPQGLDLPLGEAGARLSGGQGQRLAIARAILADRPVLLLDEPTSALDVHTEQRILELLRGIETGRTIITVTHRLSLLQDYDRVVVMEAGRVIQAGRTAEVLTQDGYLSRAMSAATARSSRMGEQR